MVFLLTSIGDMSLARGDLTRFADVALGVALNRAVYSFFKICGAESFVAWWFKAKRMFIIVVDALGMLSDESGAKPMCLRVCVCVCMCACIRSSFGSNITRFDIVFRVQSS